MSLPPFSGLNSSFLARPIPFTGTRCTTLRWLSAPDSEEPLAHFEPRQKGLPMSELSTETVICGMETAFRYLK